MREATLMFTQTSASIVLVEDHTILREGLRALIELEPDLKVIGEARTAAEGVRLVSGYLRRNDPASDPCPRITEREREVLTRIALGESSKRVAVALCLSVKTVEKHRANVMRKLALHNTAALTLFAVRNGLLPQDAERCFAEVELARFRGHPEVGSAGVPDHGPDGLIPAAV